MLQPVQVVQAAVVPAVRVGVGLHWAVRQAQKQMVACDIQMGAVAVVLVAAGGAADFQAAGLTAKLQMPLHAQPHSASGCMHTALQHHAARDGACCSIIGVLSTPTQGGQGTTATTGVGLSKGDRPPGAAGRGGGIGGNGVVGASITTGLARGANCPKGACGGGDGDLGG